MKTKYIKVLTADRLPKETETYMTSHGWFTWDNGEFYNDEYEIIPYINYWLEEIPDREEKMRDLLEKVSKFLKWQSQIDKTDGCKKAHEDIDKLLNELKQ